MVNGVFVTLLLLKELFVTTITSPKSLAEAMRHALKSLGTSANSRQIVVWIQQNFPGYDFSATSVRTSLPTVRTKYLESLAGSQETVKAPRRAAKEISTTAKTASEPTAPPIATSSPADLPIEPAPDGPTMDGPTTDLTVDQLCLLSDRFKDSAELEAALQSLYCAENLLKLVPTLEQARSGLAVLKRLRNR